MPPADFKPVFFEIFVAFCASLFGGKRSAARSCVSVSLSGHGRCALLESGALGKVVVEL
jgi:hypothetical protein